MSKLYLLKRINRLGYDEYDGFLISADSESEARSLCKYADEGDIWGDSSEVSCKEVAPYTEEPKGIVLERFNAG